MFINEWAVASEAVIGKRCGVREDASPNFRIAHPPGIGGESRSYRPGERCDVPAGAVHSASMGPEGCRYLIGEKIAAWTAGATKGPPRERSGSGLLFRGRL